MSLKAVPRPLRAALTVGAWAALAVLSACAPIPKLDAASPILQPEQLGLSTEASAAVNARWWQAWGDAQLDVLMDKALRDAPSLAAARARIQLAGASIENERAADRPSVGLGLDLERQRFTENGLYPPPLAGSIMNTGNLQATLVYDWDFFGRHEAALQAAIGRQAVAQNEAAAARLSLSSAVARAWLGLARSLSQEQLIQEQLLL